MRQLAFFAAIEVGDEPSAAEGLDLDSMVVEPEYDGVRLENEMTQEFIDDMMERFKNGKKIHRKYVYQIIIAVKNIVYDEATMVEMEIPDDVELTVCGDTHGWYSLDSRGEALTNWCQANTLISWNSSAGMELPTTNIGTCSTVTLSTEDHGPPRLPCFCMRSSGCGPMASSSIVATTRQMT